MLHSVDSSMVPSSQRPIPFKMRPDLVVKRVEYRGVPSWVVKDPVGLKYHRLDPEQQRCLELLNGERNLEQLEKALCEEFPSLHLQLSDVQGLVTELHKKNIVYSDRPGQGASLLEIQREQDKKKRWNAVKNLLYLRLPGWDPEPTLRFLYPYVKFLFHPLFIFLASAFVISSWVLLLVNFSTFQAKLPEFQQFFGWPNLIYLWVTLALIKILHEFGHGMSCLHFGGECHEMGVMLLVFSPTLYCDVTDSWMMRNKWHRILIGAAGIIVEVFISAIAIYTWWFTQPGLLHHLALNLFFVTTVTTVIFNANPLMRFDGYYMMSDFLEIPNLRPKADKTLREKFAWFCLGIEPKPDRTMPTSGRFWFILFAISAWLYRWIVVFGITLFLYTVLKPYELQSIGITLAFFSVVSIFWGMGQAVYQILMAPRQEPISKVRLGFSLIVLAALVTGTMMIPIPWHLESPVLLEPTDLKHVYTTTDGVIEEIFVEPGDVVEPGTVLMRMSNIEKELELQQYRTELKDTEVRINTADKSNNFDEGTYLRESRDNLKRLISQLEKQFEELEVRAPIAGRIIAAPRRPEPKVDPMNHSLSRWTGTPLDKANIKAYLEPKTHLMSIAPDENFVAQLVIEQEQRDDLQLEEEVELKFSHLPNETYVARVTEIGDRPLEFAPEALSNKAGGPLATATDEQGNERLQNTSYLARVALTDDVDLLRTGLRGQARFLVDERTAGQWLWRYIRNTFHFRL
ncbi:MAG: hypothetical protein CMJ46_07420 [Planctomyces sp.]|nr:hypothetical protein [Planctomyces sp.]